MTTDVQLKGDWLSKWLCACCLSPNTIVYVNTSMTGTFVLWIWCYEVSLPFSVQLQLPALPDFKIIPSQTMKSLYCHTSSNFLPGLSKAAWTLQRASWGEITVLCILFNLDCSFCILSWAAQRMKSLYPGWLLNLQRCPSYPWPSAYLMLGLSAANVDRKIKGICMCPMGWAHFTSPLLPWSYTHRMPPPLMFLSWLLMISLRLVFFLCW